MLDPATVQALLAARHSDPFSVLGLHADAAGALWLRALLPGASAVVVIDATSGKPLVELMRIHNDGLFEARIPLRRERFDYRLAVRWQAGGEGVYADAYAYGSLIGDAELQAFHEGRHGRPYALLGAHSAEASAICGSGFTPRPVDLKSRDEPAPTESQAQAGGCEAVNAAPSVRA